MVTDIRVPKLGMSEDDITIIKFCVENCESVNKGNLVVIIETAKVSHEVLSPASGLVFHVKEVNDKVGIGSLLAVVADSQEEFEAYERTVSDEVEIDIKEETDETTVREDSVASDDEGADRSPDTLPEEEVEELNGCRVLKRIPFVGMRRTIANNLHNSLQSGAQLTIVSETDMTALDEYLEELRLDYPDTRITYVDLVVKMLPVALKEFPILNSIIYGDDIICWDECNIGVAMSLDEGLVVPVIREADKKSLVQISRKIKSLAKKARGGQLSSEDLNGGTFSFSSGGKVDTDIITPIIKPPETAILAIGKIGPKPAVFEGKLTIRTMTNLCLTHDHRVIDGVPAANFLGRLKEIIESPDIFSKLLN